MQKILNYCNISLILIFTIIIIFGSAHADKITVCLSGCNYDKIQDAIDDANPGDIIEVQNGTYQELLNISKQIILRGQNAAKDKPVIDAARGEIAVTLSADGIILEGFNITNSYIAEHEPLGCTGIDVLSNNNTITDNMVFNNENGIVVKSSNNNITKNIVMNNYQDGINFLYANRNKIINNFVYNNEYNGFEFNNSSENTLTGNNISSNKGYGILLMNASANNTLVKNLIFDNGYNFVLEAWARLHFNNNIDESNLVNGKPIYYLINVNDKVIDSDAGTVFCIDCNNTTIRNLNISRNSHGICLYNTSNSIIENSSLSRNFFGIGLYNCSNDTIKNNNVSHNKYNGIHIDNSSNITLIENSMSNNRYNFVLNASDRQHLNNSIDTTNHVNGKSIYYLMSALDIDILDNAGTIYCIYCVRINLSNLILENNGHGIFFYNTSDSRVENCQLNNNLYGIFLQDSDDNTIVNNSANNNGKDSNFQEFSFNGSENNTIESNTFDYNGTTCPPVNLFASSEKNPPSGPVLRIKIDSTPRDAKIWADGEYKGVTPKTINLDRKGNHLIKLNLSGYEDLEEWHEITSSNQAITMSLVPISELIFKLNVSINSIPEGASICIDKNFTGNFTPNRFFFDGAGNHTYELYLDNYEPHWGNFSLPEDTNINVTLVSKKPKTSSGDTDSGNGEGTALPDIPAWYSLASMVFVYYFFSKRGTN